MNKYQKIILSSLAGLVAIIGASLIYYKMSPKEDIVGTSLTTISGSTLLKDYPAIFNADMAAIDSASVNWDTAYTDRLKWNGGATGLVAATGRTSLGLGSMALEASSTYYLASNPSSYITLTGLSSSATGLTYTNTTGAFSLTSGYIIPTTASTSDWDSKLSPTGSGANLTISRIGASTYSTIQHLQDIFHSAGWVSGGSISDAGGASVNVAAGTGLIRTSNVATATVSYFDWAASSSIAIASGTIAYIGVEYNGGSPRVTSRSSLDWDYKTDFPLGRVTNENGSIYIANDVQGVGDHAANMILREYQTMPFAKDVRSGGLILSDSADNNRHVGVTAGAIWDRLNRYALSASSTSYFDVYAGTTRVTTGTSTWPNTQYNNAGTVTTMTANHFANLWFYETVNGNFILVLGTAEYTTLAAADLGLEPSTLPNRVTANGKLLGRIQFQKSATVAAEVDNSDTTNFSSAAATNHANLSNLNWSAAGHTFDIDLNLNGHNLTTGGAVISTSSSFGTLTVTGNSNMGTIVSGNWNGNAITDTYISSSANWNTAYTDRLKWDGGATGLTAATGRTSLGLGSMALLDNTGSTTITTLGTITNLTATNLTVTTATSGTLIATSDLILPTSATLVTNSSGSIGIDTTSGQLRYNDGTATRTLTYIQSPTVTLASTTLTGGSATTTIPLGYALSAETWNSVICGTDTGTSTLRFGDGTNYTNVVTATTTPISTTLSSNNAFVAAEKRQIQVMTTTGSPNYISCTVSKTTDQD